MRTGAIYGLLCPLKKQIVYVGQTTSYLHKRLSEHRAPKARFRKSALNAYTNMLIERRLSDQLQIVVLRDGLPIDKLDRAEQVWIAKLKSEGCELLNRRKSGFGRKRAYDNLARPIQSMTGLNNPLPKSFLRSIKRIRSQWGGLMKISEVTGIKYSRLQYIIDSGAARNDEFEKLSAITQPDLIAA